MHIHFKSGARESVYYDHVEGVVYRPFHNSLPFFSKCVHCARNYESGSCTLISFLGVCSLYW